MTPTTATPGPAAADDGYAASVDELTAIASVLADNPEVVANVERLVSDRLGVAVRQVRREIVIPPTDKLQRYIDNRRTQSRHWLTVPDGCELPPRFASPDGGMSVFLKAGRAIRNLAVDELLNHAECDACLPFYFGSFAVGDRIVALWQAVDGEHIAFDALPPEPMRKLMQAVAALNALPAAEFARVLPHGPRWAVAPVSYYEDLYSTRMTADQREQWRAIFDQTTDLVREDGPLTARVRALGTGFLTHNDINRNNVLFLETGEVAVLDWEGATLSFPGADLRFLARLDRKEALLDCYAERLNTLGVNADRDDVLAGYAIAEGLRMVYRGWAVMSPGPVANGLALVKSVLDR